MYTKAKSPEKLFVRVLQQRDPEVDVDCLEEYCNLMAKEKVAEAKRQGTKIVKSEEERIAECPYKNQIFIHEIHAKEAAGPTWARGLLSKDIEEAYKKGDLKPQDHCMSIDSHMNFEPEWDDKMVTMWDDALNEYAVLSTYVTDVEHLGEDGNGKPHHEVPHLCMIKYTTNVRTHATKCVTDLSKPKLTNAVWGAGLSFSKCHAELKVQVDPHTPHIFDGEEFNRAARFWTYGYDIYTPNHVYVLHDYHKSQSNPVMQTWGQNKNAHGTFAASNKRLRTMIDLPGGEKDSDVALKMKQSKYGLGDRRSLDQLIQFSGFDLRNEEISIDGKNRCGNIQWVPFTEHPKGVNYIPQFDNLTEDPLDLPYDPSSIWYASREAGVMDGDNGDNSGLPEGADLGAKHAQLEEVLEGEELLLSMDMNAKHAELEMALEEEKLVEDGLEQEHDKLVKDEQAEEIENEVRYGEEGKLSGGNEEFWEEATHHPLNEHHHFQKSFALLRGAPANIREKERNLLEKHHFQDHGFHKLPLFVQVNVLSLVCGLFFVICKSAGSGHVFKRYDRKKC